MSSVVVGAVGVGVGPRAIAIIIDAILIGVVGGILAAITSIDMMYLLFGLLSLLYFPVMEKTQGATVGKMVVGLKVVTEEGTGISWGQAIIRTLLRLIDGLFIYLIGAIFVWTSPRNQRLGDKAAKTLVVKKGAIVSAVPSGQF